MKRSQVVGRCLRLAVCASTACAALTLGATGALGATATTQYDVVATESPDPGFNSRFAERLSDAGDLTGDGIRDIFASTWVQDLPAAEVGGVADNNAGRVALINGATQKVVYKVTPEPQEGANFGFYISVPGDVGPNRDGREDLVAGASGYDVYTGTGPACGQPEPNGCNENQGRGYVLSGPTGQVIRTLDNFNPQANGGFASRLGAAGDVTGDGVADILAAAPSNDFPAGCGNLPVAERPANCSVNEGEVFVVNGATFGLVRSLRIPAEDRRPLPCASACGSLGGGPQVVGDVNGDSVPDHLVPATGFNPDPSRNGRIYIFSGANGAVLSRIDQPDPDSSAFFGLQDLDRFAPGDLNADGVPELYGTGFVQDGPAGISSGRSWVFDGRASVAQGRGVLLREYIDPFAGPARAFGWGLSRTDYNKDGRTDSYVSNLQGQNTTTSIFDGRDGSLLKNLVLPESEAQATRPVPGGGQNSGSALGWSSRAPGDLNRDGEPDYVAAAPYQDVGESRDQGKVFFFLSNVPSVPSYPTPDPGRPNPNPPASAVCPAASSLSVIRGTAASNRITGTIGADRVFAGGGNDVVDTLAGNDCVDLGTGADRGQGGPGRDTMQGGRGNDRVSASSGNDRLRGGPGNDRLIPGSGNDSAFGDAGNDRISGSSGRDRIEGGAGSDRIAGGSSGDRIAGGRGNDRLDGNSGSDRISGSSGSDRISARDGKRDRINCGSGRDRVVADRIDRVARNCERVKRPRRR